mgnify:CR=1 FL=1
MSSVDANLLLSFFLQMSSHKPTTKPLAIVPSSQPIVAPPIDLVNRYHILCNIPKPSYTSALALDLFAYQSITPMPPNKSTSRTDYVLKQSFNLFNKEPVHKIILNVLELDKSYFPSGWHFIPSHKVNNFL